LEKASGFCRVQLADFFELDTQAVAERTLGPQFFQKGLGLIECVWGNILAFEQVSEAALNFILGEQGDLPLRVPQSGTSCKLDAAKINHPRAANWPGHWPVISFHSIGGSRACKSDVIGG